MSGRELYAEYLRSPAWASKRERVMQRAGGVCEGCRGRPATEVHHLTYEHVTQEFLFELVAICGDCHARLHCEAPKPARPSQQPSPAARAMQGQLANLAVKARAKLLATTPTLPPPMDERMAALARKFHEAEGDALAERPPTNKGEAA